MASNPYLQRAQQLQDQRWDNQLRLKTAPLSLAIAADQQRLAMLKEGTPEHDAVVNNLALNIGRMRTVYGDPTPHDHPGRLAETVNMIREKLRLGGKTPEQLQAGQTAKVDKWNAENLNEAQEYATGAIPYEQTPAGIAQARKTADTLKEIDARNAATGWTRLGNPVQVETQDGKKWMQPFSNKAGETKLEPMPEGYNGPPPRANQSQYATQRAAYAQSLGKTPDQMTWADEQNFLTGRYKATQPYAERRLGLEQSKLNIAQDALNLRYAQTDWKQFQDTFKQLSPMQKVQTTAELASDYVNNPTGPGDVALTLAFFEVAKAADPGSGSGIRFTQQEQKLIIGARGWADAAKANAERWGSGTLYDDRQRKQMAEVIQMAARKASAREQEVLGAAGSFNPKAAAGAAGAAGTQSPVPGLVGPLQKRLRQLQQQGVDPLGVLK